MMNTLTISGQGRHRRKLRYVDEALQKFLLIGLVALESGLAAGLAWMMYRRLDRIVQDNLFRVHLADAGPVLGQLVHEAIILLAVFAVANLLVVLLVEIVWRRHVHSITRLFGRLMDKTARLDFTADPEIGDAHQVVHLAASQRAQDRTRLAEIRRQLSRLDHEAAGVQDVLNALDRLMPRNAAATSPKGSSISP
jgi:hypothetical protein